jgi:hypothetical protein
MLKRENVVVKGERSEALNSRVKLDRFSRGERVDILACSGFQHSRELVCVKERTPEAQRYKAPKS